MVFFKDYSKEVKDLLTKNTAEGKAPPMAVPADGGKPVPKKGQFNEVCWKVESKLKPSTKTPVVVNPVGDAKGVSANIEFVVPQVDGLKGKVTVKPDTCAKPTVTYECCGRKLEASVESFKGIAGWEATLEDKQKAYQLVAKVNGKAVSAEASVPVTDKVEAGASAEYSLADRSVAWSVGARYKCQETVFSFTTAAAKKFSVGAIVPVPGVQVAGKNVFTGLQVDYALGGAVDVVAGVAAQVPACPFNSSFKFKINKSLAMSVAHFVELAGWKVATSFDVKEKKVGVVLTLE